MIQTTCQQCGTIFDSHPSARRRFCSSSCAGKVGPKTHGESRSRLYATWSNMKSRCKGTAGKLAKKYYFDRGIKVCDEWARDFRAFRRWALANGYKQNLELDRRENDKGYFPENCQWVTRKQQRQNTHKRRDAKTSRFKGVSKHFGLFASEENAARAYDEWAINNYGEYANPNFKQGGVSR